MCSNRRSERGQALVLFAILFVFMLGMVGLAIDGSRLYAEHARLQSAADAAAIGAAHELRRGNRDYRRDLEPAALHDAALHGFDAKNAEVIVHHPPVSGPYSGSPDHVEVVVRAQLQNTFMAMFGAARQAVSGRAVAGLAAGEPPCIAALGGGYVVEGEQPFEIDCPVASDAAADLFADLRMPGCDGRPLGAAEQSEDASAETLYWPGCHEEPVTVRAGVARFMPGTHIFLRGLELAGGEVRGENVSLLFPASAGQTGVALRPEARAQLQAPARGEFAGVLMFAESGPATLARGEGSELQGALYFPKSPLHWAPNPPGSLAWTQAVAERVVILEAPGGRAALPSPAGATAVYKAVLAE